jgi:hypothetical protein
LEKDIASEADQQYRRLLQNQYRAIKADWIAIEKTAKNLRKLVLTDDDELGDYDKQIKSRCCNLAVLETVFKKYEKL